MWSRENTTATDSPSESESEMNTKGVEVDFPEDEEIPKMSKKEICLSHTSNYIIELIPLLVWLPRYSVRENLCGDVIAGVSVSVYHLSQGMAYAILAEVPAIHGIYMGIFQVFVYSILGTSRHVSVGSMAVTALMTGSLLSRKLSDWGETHKFENVQIIAGISVAMACKFLGLGILCRMCKTAMVNGFTAGCAIQIATLQMKTIMGLSFEPYRLPGWMILTWHKLVIDIENANLATVVISLITLLVLIVNIKVIKPFASRYTVIPVPIELIIIIIATIICYAIKENIEAWDVSCIGDIPTGMPAIIIPPLELIGLVFADTVPIAIVAYSVTIAMAFLLAGDDYVIDPNQELFAQGAATTFGSIFGCPPTAGSVSRSVLQKETGGKTQMTGLFCAVILFIIAMSIANYFEKLPKCVLATIIMWAVCYTLIRSIKYAIFVWKADREDGKLWLYTFTSSAFLDVIFGIFVGCLCALRLIVVQDNAIQEEILERKLKLYEEEVGEEDVD